MTHVEKMLIENYEKTEDFEILLYVITHKKDFTDEMVKWVTDKINKLD